MRAATVATMRKRRLKGLYLVALPAQEAVTVPEAAPDITVEAQEATQAGRILRQRSRQTCTGSDACTHSYASTGSSSGAAGKPDKTAGQCSCRAG